MMVIVMEHEITIGVKDFILGGNSSFTIFQEPNIQAKYSVKANDSKTCWFVSTELKNVSALTDDAFISGTNLVYQGYLKTDLTFNVGKKGVSDYNEKSINALLWVLRHASNLPPNVHIYHHGKCSVCGRKLTDAMSLRCGIGPTCLKRL